MTLLAHDRYCDEIAYQVGRLRDVVTSGADLSATVPTCPDWSLEQLVRHVGGALRWVDTLVRARAQENIPREEVPDWAGPEERGDAAALEKWLGEAGESVVAALREAGPDVAVWTWMGLLTTGFWARRMTHETAVHHADAALAAGLPYEIASEVAADALDESLELTLRVLPLRGRDEALREGPARSVHLHATDTGAALDAEWLMEFGAGRLGWRRGHEKATVALRGPLTALLLASYRRLPLDTPGLEVLGDREVLEFWVERVTFG
ncbi:maleylpyruvate isomerase family mycothiol-dependent enzyme [Streptomyces sp. NBC_00820]|uniref:maleylpyruvate isomerase family mycothiol-dependent enzyme n=1 Tax=Streptomyces sp. NBC_00820 TaxID=2975842 RepID=UPI002ED480F4|nr:maleylpyruvate isomerase family mycothiol-dependent enzyme [Streptomyces sp. NBC_00820]